MNCRSLLTLKLSDICDTIRILRFSLWKKRIIVRWLDILYWSQLSFERAVLIFLCLGEVGLKKIGIKTCYGKLLGSGVASTEQGVSVPKKLMRTLSCFRRSETILSSRYKNPPILHHVKLS